jgi:hypothetical protein
MNPEKRQAAGWQPTPQSRMLRAVGLPIIFLAQEINIPDPHDNAVMLTGEKCQFRTSLFLTDSHADCMDTIIDKFAELGRNILPGLALAR